MIDFINETLHSLVATFTDPQKRVFIGYLVSGWVIGIVWLVRINHFALSATLKQIFSPADWFSKSARADYLIIVINRLVLGLLAPRLISQLAIATLVFESLHSITSPDKAAYMPVWLIGFLFTFTLFIFDDASKYVLHRWMHRSPLLWRFHRIHHTATHLTPLTIFRTHPLEGLLFVLRSSLVQGTCIGIFVFMFGNRVDLLTILGANLFIFVFNALGANLRHSSVTLCYPDWLEAWLISPAQHQIHHSNQEIHYDCNYGIFLSIWDRLGNTLCHSEKGMQLSYGVTDQNSENEHSLKTIYIKPFLDVNRILADFVGRKRQELTCKTRSISLSKKAT